MATELTIVSKLPDISVPGVVSGCRLYLSSENYIGVTAGRFVTPTGGFAEIRRTVPDCIKIPENKDIIYVVGAVIGNGVTYRACSDKEVGREETVLGRVKVLKYPAKLRGDIIVTHSLRSSNPAMSKLVILTSSADGETSEYVVPWRIPVYHHSHVYVGGIEQEEGVDYNVFPVKDSSDRRYTKIKFDEAPAKGAEILVETGIMGEE